MKKLIVCIAAILTSGLLMLSIPLLNILLSDDVSINKSKTKTQVDIKKIKIKKEKLKPKKKLKRPQRKKAKQRNIKSGPRFAMDLGLAGLGGVNVPVDMTNRSRGDGSGEMGEVDEKPSAQGMPPFQLPDAIRKKEVNAYLVLSFCVNVNGRAFDIQVLDENPKGLGLASAGKQAIKAVTYSPAMLEANPVAFCGMEQPFEVKFND